MILPLYNGWSDNDILARLAGLPKTDGPELVQETFRKLVNPADFTAAWNKFLHDGFVPDIFRPVALNFTGALAKEGFPTPVSGNAYEVVFPVDSKLDDGRYNNNGWMQELPDPITKMSWDNAVWVSPKTAKDLDLINTDFVEIAVGNAKITAPVFVVPGHADNSVAISLGWGRSVTGRVGVETGFNAYPLTTSAAPYFAVGAKLSKTGKRFEMAQTQTHFSIEGRALVREGLLATYQEEPDFAKKMGGDEEIPKGGYPSIYTHPPLDMPNQWGMTIDLSVCTGCTTCMIACQSENNVPIVGKEQVINGRSMHWMRNDRYFVSDQPDLQEDLREYASDPEMVMQPMLCQHCENAPCETVCPVNATIHSPDGLNVMAYNRCIGTRYCANNCPFKVRRFNFFDYNQRPIEKVDVPILGKISGLHLGPLTEKGSPETIKMQKNPNVTVRMRGVMEKCTFCVQRIQEARIATKVKAGASDNVRIPADSFTTACAQACPTDAIVFGDISNPESRVSKLKAQQKNYRLLEYLNVNARVSYLARLRNPNMKMPGVKQYGSKTEHRES
jgi:molybdopterin-containing oxidoreductase family iron-sulfur binding subunit